MTENAGTLEARFRLPRRGKPTEELGPDFRALSDWMRAEIGLSRRHRKFRPSRRRYMAIRMNALLWGSCFRRLEEQDGRRCRTGGQGRFHCVALQAENHCCRRNQTAVDVRKIVSPVLQVSGKAEKCSFPELDIGTAKRPNMPLTNRSCVAARHDLQAVPGRQYPASKWPDPRDVRFAVWVGPGRRASHRQYPWGRQAIDAGGVSELVGRDGDSSDFGQVSGSAGSFALMTM